MKTRNHRSVWGNRMIALFCICNLLLAFISPISAYAATATEDYLCPAEITNLAVEHIGEDQMMVSGTLSDMDFSVVGKFYRVYDDINSGKIYFVESEPDYSGPIYILNMEFESSAALHNLNNENHNLEGKDVVRMAAYADGEFYYAEQQCVIPEAVIEAVIPLSKESEAPAMERIISNCAWYSYVEPKSLALDESDGGTVSRSTYATPKLGDSLDAVDIDVISKIGRAKFASEQFVYGWETTYNTGGYLIESVEWPSGSGNILTYCLYYGLVMNTPKASDARATLQVELIADRQYLYIASENTIEAHFLGTDFRMYDVKLALACAQTSSNSGYDYIYEQTTSLKKNDSTNPCNDIAKAMIMQFDKYGVLSVADAVFNAFSTANTVSGTSHFYWPSDYAAHYAAMNHDKRANTMVRAVRVDTDGHLLNEEGAFLYSTASVMDRDYEYSTTNVSMTKAIKFAFSYNLRSKNAIWFWIGRGDDRGNITREVSKTYTK